MAIKTTCIGAYPKPDYVPIRDWFDLSGGLADASGDVTRGYSQALVSADAETEALFVQATRAAVEDQVSCGIDVPTDGEQRRENYIHYHCRHLEGFDFETLEMRVLREGAYSAELPRIVGPVRPSGEHFLDRDFKIAQRFTERPVKITVPGPLTIINTTANVAYEDERTLAFDLAEALNFEIRALADAGCRYIQVDEPLFARNVGKALDYGVECLERCFDGVPAGIVKSMHMCCGYPEHLDDDKYPKADPLSYFELAAAVDASTVDEISIEDAHRHNDLSLLEKFSQSTVIFGCVTSAQSRIETVDEIAGRLRAALRHIDGDRLVAAPDCGLAMLGRERAMAKLQNMCQAAALL